MLAQVTEASGKEKSILPCCRGSCWLGEKNPYSNKRSEKLLCYLHENEASELFFFVLLNWKKRLQGTCSWAVERQ